MFGYDVIVAEYLGFQNYSDEGTAKSADWHYVVLFHKFDNNSKLSRA
jgi:hypothetical protein